MAKQKKKYLKIDKLQARNKLNNPEKAGSKPGFNPHAIAVAISIITFIAFWPALSGEFLTYDDNLNFADNLNYRGLDWNHVKWMFTTFHVGHYQPITWLTLGWDFELARLIYGDGMNPKVYHFTSNLLHAINAGLFFLLILRLLMNYGPRIHNRYAMMLSSAIPALFFAINPMRVESVAWLTERRDLVSALFLLLTLLAYQNAVTQSSKYKKWILAATLFYLLGLISKVILITLPFVLLILDWYPLKRFESEGKIAAIASVRRLLIEKLPMFVMAFVFGFVVTKLDSENQWLVSLQMHGVAARIAQFFYSNMFYIIKTIFPFNLLPMYEMHRPLDPFETRFIFSGLGFIILVWLIMYMRKRKSVITCSIMAYILLLIPVSGLVQTGAQIVAIRYSYLPCMSLSILLSAAIAALFRYDGVRFAVRPAIAVAGVWMVVLFASTWQYCKVWHDSKSLWGHAVAKTTESSFAYNNFGYSLLNEKKFDEAGAFFEKAIAVQSGNEDAHFNLGIVRSTAGKKEEALEEYRKAISLGIKRPETYSNAGNILSEMKNYDEAQEMYTKALKLNPNYGPALVNLGILYMNKEQFIEAKDMFERAIRMDKSIVQAYWNLALIKEKEGDRNQARELLREALKLKPDYERARKKLEEWEQ